MTKLGGGFTVLMSVYYKNDSALLEKAIKSIYFNTLTPNYFILIVDGPIPLALRKKILSLKRKFHFNLFTVQENIGLPGALNFGLSKVKTKWVFRADADDINHPTRFRDQINFLNKYPNIDLLGSAIDEIDEYGNFLSIKQPPLSYKEIKKFIKYRNPFNHMTVAYKIDAVNAVGGYPNIFLKEDYGLWVLMISAGYYCMNLPKSLVSATTGTPFFSRRSGFKYIKSEFKIQELLVKNNFSNTMLSYFILFLRSLIFIAPTFVRIFIYKFFLRK
jgi:glycosyltransferase involved in cell wall biosynthesis